MFNLVAFDSLRRSALGFRPCKTFCISISFPPSPFQSLHNHFFAFYFFINSTTFEGNEEPANENVLCESEGAAPARLAKMTTDTDIHASAPGDTNSSKSAPKSSSLFAEDYSLSSPSSPQTARRPSLLFYPLHFPFLPPERLPRI